MNFHIGDILSVATGKLVSPSHIKGVYEILSYMTGDDLYTHQIPRVMDECAPALLRQYPQLSDVDASGVNAENLQDWLTEQASRFGKYLPVDKIEAYTHRDPVEELLEMAGQDKAVIALAIAPKNNPEA